MTARVLVVDDMSSNVKLLESKLVGAYFEVFSALNGPECLAMIDAVQPDIILLDIMMPGMDGLEVCRRIKSNWTTAHIPVVMVTALEQASDRVAGFEAGADDFLSKPVDDAALLSRVRNLVRLKLMTDEMRSRRTSDQDMGIVDPVTTLMEATPSGRVLIVEDRKEMAGWLVNALHPPYEVSCTDTVEETLARVRGDLCDMIVISLGMRGLDGLRLYSLIRTLSGGRHIPIVALVNDGDRRKLTQAMELGVNDYVMRSADKNEIAARVRTQLRKKNYVERLRQNARVSLEMANTDQLTGLSNRRSMLAHLENLISATSPTRKSIGLLMFDIDRFKSVNDQHGHDIGDEVLKVFAKQVAANVRSADLACRYGGEEFVVLMPDTDEPFALAVAERLRKRIEEMPIVVSPDIAGLGITVSVGVAISKGTNDTPEELLRRADQALYSAKRAGRNRVGLHADFEHSA